MNYPRIPLKSSTRDVMDVFKGYNHNLRISDGEFYDMQNMTSDLFPILSPRKRRGVFAKPASPQGMIAKKDICYVDGTDFVMGETRVNLNLSVKEEDCPKQLVSMGAYVIIMPDKKYINTIKPEENGVLDAEFTTTGSVQFELCSINGDSYDATISPDAPASPDNLDYWIDTSTTPNTLKQYSESNDLWVSIATTYIKITATDIGKNFDQYDGVKLSGITAEDLQDLNASAVIWNKGDDYIIVTGILNQVTTQQDAITITRKMPGVDYLVESGNRLWGCRYGMSNDGEYVNELYACKLGDFKNWNCFMGVSTDSYAVSIGSDGPFTGAVTYLGSPLFFKENVVHKVYGTYPANFQVQETGCRGVQPGCHNSLAVVNETLYYKARTGVCAFDGSLPVEVSNAFGNELYSDAVAAAHGNKYYVSMADMKGIWHTFVYDTAKGMWHKEDNLHALAFCSHQGELYCVDADDRNIITMLGSGSEDEQVVHWMAQTGNLGINSPDMKYLSRITLRMGLERQSKVDIYVQYDLSDEWLHVCTMFGTDLRSFSVPIRPRRTDHIQIRIVGEGPAKIYSITKTIEQGSELS